MLAEFWNQRIWSTLSELIWEHAGLYQELLIASSDSLRIAT